MSGTAREALTPTNPSHLVLGRGSADRSIEPNDGIHITNHTLRMKSLRAAVSHVTMPAASNVVAVVWCCFPASGGASPVFVVVTGVTGMTNERERRRRQQETQQESDQRWLERPGEKKKNTTRAGTREERKQKCSQRVSRRFSMDCNGTPLALKSRRCARPLRISCPHDSCFRGSQAAPNEKDEAEWCPTCTFNLRVICWETWRHCSQTRRGVH